MIPKLYRYKKFAGKKAIEKIRASAEPLKGKHITHINSSAVGGGVAEILNSHIFLMNDLGIFTGWRLLKGNHSFFNVTKKFHNILQGARLKITEQAKRIYLDDIEKNSIMNHINDHDLIVIHDPQPLALIDRYEKRQPWIWRCHIDVTNASAESWKFFSSYINKYDAMIVTMKEYVKEDVKIPKFVIAPPTDPLTLKNKHLSKKTCRGLLEKNDIDPDRPILCQVSRFDKWKDPLGVVKIYELVREEVPDCQLVMIGDMASDDPEGPIIYNKLMNKMQKNNTNDIHIITKRADLLVNALQRTSSVVIQNSIREGFGMVVSEALWKETPVVARARGGIPLQVINGKTGYLMETPKDGAKNCLKILKDDELRQRLGKNGKEHVKKNFLITSHLQSYLDILNCFLKEEE